MYEEECLSLLPPSGDVSPRISTRASEFAGAVARGRMVKSIFARRGSELKPNAPRSATQRIVRQLSMNPFWQKDGITIYHGDQSEILPLLGDIDTVISDPPYGIDHNTEYNFSGGQVLGNQYKRIKDDDKPFDPTPFLKYRKVILWGANCYSDKLPVGSLLIWNKRQPKGNKNVMSDAEVAWMNTGHGVYIFDHVWDGFIRQSEKGENYHPTQKPVALMRWCIQKANPQGVIIDPYCGSGSLLCAARDLGLGASWRNFNFYNKHSRQTMWFIRQIGQHSILLNGSSRKAEYLNRVKVKAQF